MFVVLLSFLTLSLSVEGKVTCIGDNGEPVDMFILYKLPRIYWYKTPPYVSDGHGYAYLDSNDPQFHLSDNPINSTHSAAGRTLDQVYKLYDQHKHFKKDRVRYRNGPADQAHIFYNDENPNGEVYFKCGHTKGAVAFDKESGFWLITSVPKYPPPASESYNYPHSGCLFGQMFMCVTFNTSLFDDIGLQLRYNDPHIHDANLPKDWEPSYPNIKKAIDGDMIKSPPLKNVVSLSSLAGVQYQHFAKADAFGKDLYHDFVASSLKTDILTETWQHGTVLGPSCDGVYTVNDIVNLNLTLQPQSFPFENFDDHSKFVVGTSSKKPYVCIGDINREPTQFKRGGGTLCFKDRKVWNQFSNYVTNTTHCAKL